MKYTRDEIGATGSSRRRSTQLNATLDDTLPRLYMRSNIRRLTLL